jgi:cysteine-rich repeat protein
MRRSGCWLAIAATLAASPCPAPAGDWLPGDVFIGVSNGRYEIRSPDGATVRDILDDGLGGTTTGCLVDDAGNLWTTSWEANQVVVYSGMHPHPIIQRFVTPGTSGFGDDRNECVLIDQAGNLWVGHAEGDAQLHRYDLTGTLQQEYTCALERRGTDWFDLAANGRTMFYTSEGRNIFRYDVGASTQLPIFATLPSMFAEAFALRLLPPGDGSGGLLVASHLDVSLLDGSGAVVRTYDAPAVDDWFALALDPDGRTFWSADVYSGRVFRFDIAGGPAVTELTVVSTFVGGLCVKGELRASRPCGNGVLESGEECDDGNAVAGDGCDATCRIEPGGCSAAGLTEVPRRSLRLRKVGTGGEDVEVSFDASAVPSRADHVNVHRGTIRAFATAPSYDHGAAPGGCRPGGATFVDAGAAALGEADRYYLAVHACAASPVDSEGSPGTSWNGAVTAERPSPAVLGTATCP